MPVDRAVWWPAPWCIACRAARSRCNLTARASDRTRGHQRRSRRHLPRSPAAKARPTAMTCPGGHRSAPLAALSLRRGCPRTALRRLEPLIADVLVARELAGDRHRRVHRLRQQLDAVLASLQPQLLATEFEPSATSPMATPWPSAPATGEVDAAIHRSSLVVGAAAAWLPELGSRGTESDVP